MVSIFFDFCFCVGPPPYTLLEINVFRIGIFKCILTTAWKVFLLKRLYVFSLQISGIDMEL